MSLHAPRPRAFALASLASVCAFLLVLGMMSPAAAVEEPTPDPDELEDSPPPSVEELCVEGTVAAEFCPEVYEEPSWFQWLIYPLLIIGLVMVTVMLVVYLTWQPRFARERAEKLRRR